MRPGVKTKRNGADSPEKVKDDRADELKAARSVASYRQYSLQLEIAFPYIHSSHIFRRIKYLWQRLKETILDTVNASLENDAKERHITHGVHFNRQIMHRNRISMALLNSLTQVGTSPETPPPHLGAPPTLHPPPSPVLIPVNSSV